MVANADGVWETDAQREASTVMLTVCEELGEGDMENVALGEEDTLGDAVPDALTQSVGEVEGDPDRLGVTLGEEDRVPVIEGEALTEEDRHSEDVGLLVRLVLRERLRVTEVQPVAVPDAVRHRLEEAVELALGGRVTEPVEDTEGLGEAVVLLPPPPPLVGETLTVSDTEVHPLLLKVAG